MEEYTDEEFDFEIPSIEEIIDYMSFTYTYDTVLYTEKLKEYYGFDNSFLSNMKSADLLGLLIDSKINKPRCLESFNWFMYNYNVEICTSYNIISDLFKKAKCNLDFNSWVKFCHSFTE